jgi:hypothetical protein
MALNKNTTPAFENPDDDVTTVQDPAEMQRAAAQERLKAAANKHAADKPAETAQNTGTALTKPTGGQVAKAKPMVNPLEPLKDAFHVEWDTLRSLKLTNGNMVDQQTGKALGDEFGLELLSYQDQYVISPGVDGEAGKELVRYSDDGVTTSKGDDCAEYLDNLKKSGYPLAKSEKRLVICGSLFSLPEKGAKACPDLKDCLVQISLPKTSKATFDRYMMDQAFKIAKGFIEPTGAERIKINCEPVSKGDKDWTLANFSRWTDA